MEAGPGRLRGGVPDARRHAPRVGEPACGGDEEAPPQRDAPGEAEGESEIVRRLSAVACLGAAWLALTAATPLPLAPPPPDLTPLVRFVSAPLDKPPIKAVIPPLPPVPLEVPPIPPAIVVRPLADKPTATLPSPRTLPCVGAWTGAAAEALECGRARLYRGELADAAQALEQAARNAREADIGTEARYWLAETLYRLGRFEQANGHFRYVAQQPSPALAPFGLHGSGWTALVLGDPARASLAFGQLLGTTHPAVLDPWARHGQALALYALARYPEAQRAWAELISRRPPQSLERDVYFWYGDALGRSGEPARAAEELSRFTRGGSHPLLGTGLVRLAWWDLAVRRPAESLTAIRAYRPPPLSTGREQEAADRDWVDATLALALLATDDWDGARNAARSLETRRSPLAAPIQLRIAAAALARRDAAVVDATITEVMRGTLDPPVRAFVLTLKGEGARLENKADDARTQFDLVRGIDAKSEIGRYATLRLAQINVEMREFKQAMADVAPLLLDLPADPASRAAVLLLQAEAAYRAGEHKAAADAFQRVLTETPDRPEARAAQLGLGWAALREGHTDDAGQRFAEYARLYPTDEHATDALVLASEMALVSGDQRGARELLERVIARASTAPRTEFARLNRGILLLRSGESEAAIAPLRDWSSRAPFPPLLGRAKIALGVALLNAGKTKEAGAEFAGARREGEGALASLGLAAVAMTENRLADAERDFTEARNEGTPAVAVAADYGLSAVAFRRSDVPAFKTAAEAVLAGAPPASSGAPLLYALTGIAVEAKDWTGAMSAARRIVADFPDDERADDALERVGAAAAGERAWPVVQEAYSLLRQHYPRSPFVEGSRLAFGEALIETGRADDGRKTLEQFFASGATDPRAGRARLTLARAREMTGDRAGALEAYTAASRSVPASEWSTELLLNYARLLTQARRYDEVKKLLEPFIKASPAPVAAEGALALGEALQGQGDQAAAIEYFMTAAYIAPDTPSGRRGLLAAARAFGTLKQREAAITIYRKLLAQRDVPPDLAGAARRGLAELPR
jgi:tetratricopeptide (TPR) repeat protein